MLYQNSEVSVIAARFNDSASIQDKPVLSNEDAPILRSDHNLFCIWYHDRDLGEDVQFKMRNHLIQLFTHFCIFNDICEFSAYLIRPLIVTKIYFIITSIFADCLCNVAKNRPQYEKAYQFQPHVPSNNGSLVYTDIDELFRQISEDINTSSNEYQSISSTEPSSSNCRESVIPPPLSVWKPKTTENSFQCWKKESPEFFLFQAWCRFLIQLRCDHVQSLAEMIQACRRDYIDNTTAMHKIDDVENDYKNKNAIWFYTTDSFLFRSVGRAFRLEDFERIFIFRRYIIDLHRELDIHSKKRDTLNKILLLYRGKKLSMAVLQRLLDNIGALISMNGFLSTTRNREVAIEMFAGAGQNRSGYESVLFELFIDEATIAKTYADISLISQFPSETEVLFTIGSVWRIDSVDKYNDLYWIVKLSSYNDVNLKMLQFFEELTDDSTLLMLGDISLELGQFRKAENFYYRMLDEPTVNNETRATLHYNIAMVNMKEDKYSVALEHLHRAEKLISTKVLNTEPLTSTSQPFYCRGIVLLPIHLYNNMGHLYQKKGDTERALEYYIKALNDENNDPIDKATVYDNIGLLLHSKGQYEDALKYLSEAVKLAKDHSSLAKFKQHYDAVKKLVPSANASVIQESCNSSSN